MKSSRALRYLQGRAAALTAPDTRAGVRWQRGEVRLRDPLAGLHGVKIALIGPSESGKTTLLRQLPAALASSTSWGLPAALTLGPVGTPDTDGVTLAKGEMHVSGRSLTLSVVDLPGTLLDAAPPKARESDSSWPPLYRALRDCDLVLLTLDPRSALGAGASSPAIVQQLRAVEWAIRDKPTLAVAIGYTQADEYGVVSPQSLRLVEDEPQCDALRKVASGDADAWRTLVEGTGPTASRVRQGGALLGAKSAPEVETEWSQTRRKLMQETRPLWESLLRSAHPPPLLNGYFIAADPCDRLLAPWENRGLLQLLADFLAHLCGGR